MVNVVGARSAILDGELVVICEDGRPDFYALSARPAGRQVTVERLRGRAPATFIAFGLLWLDGELLIPFPQRRRLLEKLGMAGAASQTTPSYVDAGARLLAACASLELEGCLCKDLDRPYRPGVHCRRAWVKPRPGSPAPAPAAAGRRPPAEGLIRLVSAPPSNRCRGAGGIGRSKGPR